MQEVVTHFFTSKSHEGDAFDNTQFTVCCTARTSTSIPIAYGFSSRPIREIPVTMKWEEFKETELYKTMLAEAHADLAKQFNAITEAL